MTSLKKTYNPQPYTHEQLQAVLPTWITHVDVVDCIQSTNTALKESNPPHPVCLVAFHQTQGRGTFDRQFYCAPYQGLYVSFTLTKTPSFPVSLIIAAAITRALKSFGFNPHIKWVNDILISGKKVGGILCESYSHGTIIGFGLNVSVSEFPDELKESAGSLHQFSESLPSHLELIQAIFEHFTILMHHPQLTQTWVNHHLLYISKEVRIKQYDKITEGMCYGVNEEGHLLIKQKQHFTTFNTTLESMTLI